MLIHTIFLEAEHWAINSIPAATQNAIKLALVTTPLRMTAVICSIHIHSTGTSVPPHHPFAPVLYCMVLPRSNVSHTFVARVTLDTTHLYLDPSSHSKRALADLCHCLSVSSSKKWKGEKRRTGIKSLDHTASGLHLTSLRGKSSKHASSFLPPNFMKLGPGASSATLACIMARIHKTKILLGTNCCLSVMKYESKPASNDLWDSGKNWLHRTWKLPKGNDIRPIQNMELAIQTCSICLVPFRALVQLATRFGWLATSALMHSTRVSTSQMLVVSSCPCGGIVLPSAAASDVALPLTEPVFLVVFVCLFSALLWLPMWPIFVFKPFLVCGPRGTRWEDDGMDSTVLHYGDPWWTLLALSTVILKNGVTWAPENTGTASAWL